MPIARTPWIDDDGSGTTGTVINNAEKTLLYNQIDAAIGAAGAVGAPVNVPFSAANFTTPTAGATWVVSAATYSYIVIGKAVFVTLLIESTGTITGAPVRLYVALPPALVPTQPAGGPFAYYAGVAGTGLAQVKSSPLVLDLLRDSLGTTYAPGAMSVYLQTMYFIA
jgi:hypothetical protein